MADTSREEHSPSRSEEDTWDLNVPRRAPSPGTNGRHDTSAVEITFDAPNQPQPRIRQIPDGDAAGEDVSGTVTSSLIPPPVSDQPPVPAPSSVSERPSVKSSASVQPPPRGEFTARFDRFRADRTHAEQRAVHQPELLLAYRPEYGLIEEVRVYRWPSKYQFYEQFCRDAQRLFSRVGKPAEPEPFFSYIPQYAQLSKDQLAYYLWWRENVRHGEYLPCDFSYLLLYIYEIINLPDLIPPPQGAEQLVSVWLAYRDKHRQLDKYLIEWLCDYCLIHKLPPPERAVREIIPFVREKIEFREFYLSADGEMDGHALIDLCSNYTYAKSKYAAADPAFFARHIEAAVDFALKQSGTENGERLGEMQRCRMSRDAFCGSLCAHNIKRRIDVEYLSYTRSHDFRTTVTNMVKYAENRVRAYLRIRSRLGVKGLPNPLRIQLDTYFDRELPMHTRLRTEKAPVPDYERRYDMPKAEMNIHAAEAIESAAWDTTDLLLSAFTQPEEDVESSASVSPPPNDAAEVRAAERILAETASVSNRPLCAIENQTMTQPPTQNENCFAEFVRTLPEPLSTCLRALFRGENFSAVCAAQQMFADTAVAEINDFAVNATGDIIIDGTDGEYTMIEEYREELLPWMNERT